MEERSGRRDALKKMDGVAIVGDFRGWAGQSNDLQWTRGGVGRLAGRDSGRIVSRLGALPPRSAGFVREWTWGISVRILCRS